MTALWRKISIFVCRFAEYICWHSLGCRGHDRMVVGFTTAYAISAYYH